MKLCNKVNQTVKVGREIFTADIRHVSLNGEVMRGRVLMNRGDSKSASGATVWNKPRSIPVRCVNGHRVWLPL